MTDTTSSSLQSVLDAGMALGQVRRTDVNGTPFAVLPAGAEAHSLEHLLVQPSRAKGLVTAHDADSFARYFKRFRSPASMIFADRQRAAVVGVLNHHGQSPTEGGAAIPGWGDWRIEYTMPKSLQWQRWRAADGRAMHQADFVRFIEENRADIRTPSGAEILEISKHLEAKRTVDFVSATRLSDGTRQFSYKETTHGATSQGNLVVPEEFTLGLAVYVGEAQAWPVTAFLRYRIDAGKLLMWFDLHNVDEIEEKAFAEAVTWIGTDTGVKPLMGAVR